MRRGQATLFIIAGIVLVSTVMLFVFYKDQISQTMVKTGLINKGALDVESDKVTQQMDTCLEGITGDAVLQVAMNGGYTMEPKEGFAYYSVNSQLTAPDIKKIEQSISDYAEQTIPFCVIGGQFNAKVQPKGTAKCTTKITDNKVQITATYPVGITLGEQSATVSDFTAEKDARLGLVYNIALNTIKSYLGKNGICLTCLDEEILNNEVKIDMYNSEDGNTFFVISDQKTKLNDKELVYIFAVKEETA